jgi:hypothetical protein
MHHQGACFRTWLWSTELGYDCPGNVAPNNFVKVSWTSKYVLRRVCWHKNSWFENTHVVTAIYFGKRWDRCDVLLSNVHCVLVIPDCMYVII